MTDAISRLRSVKSSADHMQMDRDNYAAFVEAMLEHGWTADDVAKYRAEVERIMKSGTQEEKAAASQFWAGLVSGNHAVGINNRIRASIAEEKRRAA